MLIAAAAVDTDVAQDVRAHLSSQSFYKLQCQDGSLRIVRRLAPDADELKAECEPYEGQREYGRFHQSHQQQKL
jgi:hypothetical protein